MVGPVETLTLTVSVDVWPSENVSRSLKVTLDPYTFCTVKSASTVPCDSFPERA
jgi:hypothetical protein